mgnify:CR=1 FL=1
MATHDFTDPIEEVADSKQAYRKQLSQQSGQFISQLATFKGTFDALYALSTTAEQATLDAKFTAFKIDAI